MEFQENLTNEAIGKKFKSQFELVNYAIKRAESIIKVGQASHIDPDMDNVALQVVEEIEDNFFLVDVEEKETASELNGKPVEERPLKKWTEPPAKKSKASKSKKEEFDED